MCWRLILEEFGPDQLYSKGEHNIVADALSRLLIDTSTDFANATSVKAQADLFGHSIIDLSPEIMPV
jgi:hypothetical protein